MFVVVNFDALAEAGDFRIERRQVNFLAWMQDSSHAYIHPFHAYMFFVNGKMSSTPSSAMFFYLSLSLSLSLYIYIYRKVIQPTQQLPNRSIQYHGLRTTCALSLDWRRVSSLLFLDIKLRHIQYHHQEILTIRFSMRSRYCCRCHYQLICISNTNQLRNRISTRVGLKTSPVIV